MSTPKIIVALVLLALASCKQALPTDQYSKQFERKVQIVEFPEVAYEVRYYTPEYEALNFAVANGGTDWARYSERLKQLQGYHYLRIRIRNRKSAEPVLSAFSGDYERRDRMSRYYHFDAGEDLKVICSGKESAPQAYDLEEPFGLSDYLQISAAFESCGSGSFDILFNDQALGHAVRVRIDPSDYASLKMQSPQ